MSEERCHPGDSYSRAAAGGSDAHSLTRSFEHAAINEDPSYRAGALEVVACVAIARVAQLEADRSRGLFERTDNVVSINRSKPGGSAA